VLFPVQYTQLGSTGARVSRICLGGLSFGNSRWKIEIDKALPIVKRALELGINFFDTANAYSEGRSEEILGELLEGYRDDIVLATKVYEKVGDKPNDQGLSRYHIMREVDRSLKRLKTDRIDLYQIHRWDNSTPIEEIVRALDDLVRLGKVRYIGASSMFAWQFATAVYTTKLHGLAPFVSMQNHYSLAYREEEREMIPFCKSQRIAILPWSPLAKGVLSGKYRRGEPITSARYVGAKSPADWLVADIDFDVAERVEEIAKEKGLTMTQIALAWLLQRGVTAPIVGFTKVEHVDDAVGSLDVKLSRDDMERLEEPYKLHQIVGHK
jgi:1-deoxyxylulose-5-phosphate synthase